MSEMICPKAKECTNNGCIAHRKHTYSSMCSAEVKGDAFYDSMSQVFPKPCPACIPYIPEQPKKPVCPDQVCKFCGRPSIDWDEECVEGFHEAADIKPSEMPLVKNLITYPPDIAEALEVGKIRQQRADMAWHKEQCKECIGFPCPMEAHDSAVASKARREFAEELIAHRQKWELTDKCIRAMAGKE